MIDYRGWRHVFKLDPDKTIGDEALEAICESGTDAIIVGGTYGVTFDNTLELMSRIRRYAVVTVLEISSLEAVVPGFDSYFVPLVLNAGDPDMLFAPHVSGLLAYGSYIHWDEIITEGYLIANPDAGVAERTQAGPIQDAATAKAYAQVATRICRLPIVYLEYSGKYGDPEVVRGCRAGVHEAHFFYGGGIRTPEQAAEMAAIADTIVVGNLIYEDLSAALATVAAVKRP
ncbi:MULTISPECIES: heptaprenylglyceryl phosphate synthase [Brevibacillus]|uniref:heptaprenylglyceryl phosphate synthase n=1 Tax=Brevibacillus TaxID=55080 RepID=UPI00203DE47A|nr:MULTISPECIES: heptaprenylglyceryl phosphate synthase [Brevibacillus]MCM3079766.1 heptaprenylglyceryl phosphate synthase [Brevibacillus invocatus]MCM3429960.1 heptaprenylglyceryl phosphate synthase [Brevibacillus invocatus]MDH4617312.1 heptaprenylglyceryl phosphate synthase [Brevibacillus sp. AY1]